jgi:hypothetical protein
MTRWFTIFALITLISSAPAEARTFEQMLKKAQHVERLSRVIGPFLQQCRSGSSLRAIQCRAIRSRMRHRVKNGTYFGTVDAIHVGQYNNTKLNFPVSVMGCLTCQGPAKLDPALYGKKDWYVTTGRPRAIKREKDKLVFPGLELAKIVRPVGPSQVESWMQSVRPNLKVQMIYRVEGNQWKANGKQGLEVKLLGYRLYNQCSGKVLASKPPSAEPAPINENANCGRRRTVVRRVEPRRRRIPQRLSGRDIKQGMKRIGSLIQECYDRYQVPGLAEAMVTVEGATGKVVKVKVLGKFKDSPTTGKCLREAVRKARFPKFRTSRMTFRYRWYLR